MKTIDDLDAQWVAAREAGVAALEYEPRAKSARYEASTRRVVVELTNGCTFIFPADMGQGLSGASDEDLADLKVLGAGFGLHWERLDADLGIHELVMGVFGSREWMRELSRRGGASASHSKGSSNRKSA